MGLLSRKKKTEVEKKDEPKAEVQAEVAAAATTETGQSKKGSVVANRIILKPLITEKAAIAQSLNKYAFIVKASATKAEIKKAIKEIYGIEPKSINTINVEGKRRRFGRIVGRRSDFKKALVTLPAGKSITIHEGV